jgi:Ser/Thr protein kinase RdoA (MazF antagonist)
MEWLRALPTDRESYGLIHTDLHLGNFFLHDGEIIAFDFDDAAYYWFIFDIAIPIYYSLLPLPMEDTEAQSAFIREFFPTFMAGYREHNEIDPSWFAAIPKFLLFRDLQLYIFCHKKFDFDNLTPGQERFLKRTGDNIRAGGAYDHLDFTLDA